jgi:hypothetical protein
MKPPVGSWPLQDGLPAGDGDPGAGDVAGRPSVARMRCPPSNEAVAPHPGPEDVWPCVPPAGYLALQ